MARRNERIQPRIQQKHKLNDQIIGDEVRLVGDNVENGVITLSEAKSIAKAKEMDLVLINPNSEPVICKVMDYKKFLYEEKKKGGQPKPKPIKELRYRPNTDDHDFEFKLKHAKSFLDKGHKVKAYVMFRGRELSFKDKGEAILLRLSVELEGLGVPEALPKFEGRKCIMIFKPINGDNKKNG